MHADPQSRDSAHAWIARLREIRALGVTVAIDDFGVRFSRLSYIARLPEFAVQDSTSGSSLMGENAPEEREIPD